MDDCKPELLQKYVNPLNTGDNHVVEEDCEGAVIEEHEDEEMSELPNVIQ